MDNMIFDLISSGGSGDTLNFKVTGNPKPASPKENTIWIDTDTPIDGWVFGAAQPETAKDGMVWIQTGTSSPVEFNALKKNGITVYPLAAKQYEGGAWVDKPAKSYQNGAWVDWCPEGVLYDYGNPCIFSTGGWSADDIYAATGEVIVPGELMSDHMYIGSETGYSGGNSYHVMCTNNKIRITASMKTLHIEYTQLALANGESFSIRVANSKQIGDYIASGKCTVSAGTTTTLDIDITSVNGEYYIAFTAWLGYDTTRAIKVHRVWLE